MCSQSKNQSILSREIIQNAVGGGGVAPLAKSQGAIVMAMCLACLLLAFSPFLTMDTKVAGAEKIVGSIKIRTGA